MRLRVKAERCLAKWSFFLHRQVRQCTINYFYHQHYHFSLHRVALDCRIKELTKPEELKKLVNIYEWEDKPVNLPGYEQIINLKSYPTITDNSSITEDDDGDANWTYKDDSLSQDEAFAAYETLKNQPVWRTQDKQFINLILHKLSQVDHVNEDQMIRYFTILDGIQARGEALSTTQWNNAIRFAVGNSRTACQRGLEAAMFLWREMEQQAKVKANVCTFNILLDACVILQRDAWIEHLLGEMARRKLRFDRFTHHILIKFYGLRYGGAAVRAAYARFVEAGHIVASDILNTVIRSLIRAGEGPAAEQIFENMKCLARLARQPASFPSDHRQSMNLAKRLNRLAFELRDDPEQLRQLQLTTPLGANLNTYTEIIELNALTHGNIDRTVELLYEMRTAGLQPHGAILFRVLRGFQRYGGAPFTSWTRERLEAVWKGYFCTAIQHAGQGRSTFVHVGDGLAYAVVEAFRVCHDRDRAIVALNDITRYWKVSSRVQSHLREKLKMDETNAPI